METIVISGLTAQPAFAENLAFNPFGGLSMKFTFAKLVLVVVLGLFQSRKAREAGLSQAGHFLLILLFGLIGVISHFLPIGLIGFAISYALIEKRKKASGTYQQPNSQPGQPFYGQPGQQNFYGQPGQPYGQQYYSQPGQQPGQPYVQYGGQPEYRSDIYPEGSVTCPFCGGRNYAGTFCQFCGSRVR